MRPLHVGMWFQKEPATATGLFQDRYNSLKKYQEYSIGELVEYVHNEYEKYKLKDKKQDTGLQNKKLDEFFIKREI